MTQASSNLASNSSSSPAATQAQSSLEAFKAGLEGIIAGESKICLIDGENRKLSYRGINVADLAKFSTFEETSYLLLKGNLPSKIELSKFVKALSAARSLPEELYELLGNIPIATHPMDALRTAVSFLAHFDKQVSEHTEEANFNKATKLLAQVPMVIASIHRIRQGLKPIPSNPKLSIAADFLYMLTGKEADKYSEEVFDDCLILHADHCFNASTFTARVTAATLSDMHSAITSAIGALKGKLHGGANQEVMKLLEEIGSADKAVGFIEGMFAKGEKVPGFGHRVYRTCEDPRATILREASRELGKRQNNSKWFDMSTEVEKFVLKTSQEKNKPIYPNVDFYSASTYAVLGIDPELFTPIFAMSRMAGWCSHVIEQHANNRLIRPQALYTGAKDLNYVPMEQR